MSYMVLQSCLQSKMINEHITTLDKMNFGCFTVGHTFQKYPYLKDMANLLCPLTKNSLPDRTTMHSFDHTCQPSDHI